MEDYASVESICNGVPVWSFSNLCYIYGVSPDLIPGVVMQEGNKHPLLKIQPKKSWEIEYNLCGSEHEMTVRTRYNETQPMLPIHLIDGDPNTVWAGWESLVPDLRPEWIRIDLPLEGQVSSVALVCAKNFSSGNYGKLLPRELEVRVSRDAWHWETVYVNQQVMVDQPVFEIQFKPRALKQVWIIGSNFQKLLGAISDRYTFSIAAVELRDPSGVNLALVSRGASVTVSSTSYIELDERLTADALWGPLQYDLGNKWVRIGGDNGSFTWPFVEHEKGRLAIDERADESITECVRNGVNVILTLDIRGNWIYHDPPRKTNWLEARFREVNDSYTDGVGAADQNAQMYQGYLRYVEYMVQHFKDRIGVFEIGNEWNEVFGFEHYMQTWFEPTYCIIKRIAPNAKVMLGSPAGFDKGVILGCLGMKWKSGIAAGKLLLDPAIVAGSDLLPERAGAFAIRPDTRVKDATVTVDALNRGQPAIVLRFSDVNNYLAALYSAADHSISLYEVKDGKWGKPLAANEAPEFGLDVKLTMNVQGPFATFSVSDGKRNASISHSLDHSNKTGAVGLINHGGEAQLFDNFQIADAEGAVIAKDTFDGPDSTVPAGWKYLSGGPNPITNGAGPRIDAIGWHTGEANAAYFSSVREFQKQCRDLGFKGEFSATEIYADSSYPPGPPKSLSEIQMARIYAKSLVGHNGLGMEAGPCNLHFTGFALGQPLCQVTWPVQTLDPVRPTMAYYVWRTIATVMDNFRAAQFPVNFSPDAGLLFFTFRRGQSERMVSVWIDGPEEDGIKEKKADVIVRGFRARRAIAVDIFNGTEQEMNFSTNGADTVLAHMLIKDYPVFVIVNG